jgi:sphingosine kinase
MLCSRSSAPCSRLEAANILLALESGEHVTSPKVEFIECVAYRLEPLTVGSFNVLDGEVIESGPIQASIMPSAINFFQ